MRTEDSGKIRCENLEIQNSSRLLLFSCLAQGEEVRGTSARGRAEQKSKSDTAGVRF